MPQGQILPRNVPYLQCIAKDIDVSMRVDHGPLHIPCPKAFITAFRLPVFDKHKTAVIVAGPMKDKIRQKPADSLARAQRPFTIAAPMRSPLYRDCKPSLPLTL